MVPQLDDALLAEGVAALGEHLGKVLLVVEFLEAKFAIHF